MMIIIVLVIVIVLVMFIVTGIGIGHALHRNGRISTYGNSSDHDLPGNTASYIRCLLHLTLDACFMGPSQSPSTNLAVSFEMCGTRL